MSGVGGATVLAPVAGDPGEVRRVAAGLGAQAELLAALARTLRGLADPSVAVWSSPAGAAFGRRAAAVSGVVEQVSHRYGVAAAALRRLAEALQEAQAEVAWSQRVHEHEWGLFVQAGDRMGLAEGSADPAQRATAGRHRAEMVAHGERVRLALRRHAMAHDTFAVADRACAAVLRSLLDDGLADSRLYDALTGASRVAAGASDAVGTVALLPPLRPLGAVAAVAGGVGLAADAAVLVGFGDGDPAGLALGVAGTAVSALGPVLKTGARATNATVVAAAPSRTARRELRLTQGDRWVTGLGRGATAVGRKGIRLVDPPKARPALPWRAPPRDAAVLRPWLREQVQVRATQWAKVHYVDDFTAVLRAPGASARWHLAGVGADLAASGIEGGESLRRRRVDAREQADLRESGERHR